MLRMIIKKLCFLSYYSIKEFFLSKIFYIVIFFLMFSFFISTIVGIMAVSEEKKVLLDFFAATGGMAVLIFAIIYPPISINAEVETKRIYLILSKSVSRVEWFVAKFFSFFIASIILIISVNFINFLFLVALKGYSIDMYYLKFITVIFIKIFVIISISMSLSLITTSQYSTILITTMIWTVAHFAKELKQSLVHIKSLTQYFAYTVYLLPDFSHNEFSISFLFHCLIYSLAWLYAGLVSFRKKEL